MEQCEKRLHDIDKKILALKKGNNDQLELNINSKFDDLKKMFASLEDFRALGEKVNGMELLSNEQGRKLKRIA
jgi:hypothetical protein